jgi:hypothetical protein
MTGSATQSSEAQRRWIASSQGLLAMTAEMFWETPFPMRNCASGNDV